MIGVFVNTATVLLGSFIGLLLKKGIPERVSQAVMVALGLCTLYIGIDGAMGGDNTIVLIIAMVAGTVVGTLLNIDGRINQFGSWLEKKMKQGKANSTFADGFVTASLLFCVGAMTIVGSINAGLTGDNSLIFTKSCLDLISSCMLASSLGIGVMFAAAFVFVFQGALVLLSGCLQTVLTDPSMISEITCAGSVMVIGVGINLIGLKKIKVADMLPAVVFVPLFLKLYTLIMALLPQA